jgi:orotidine-5'-phosphate decarboxylase
MVKKDDLKEEFSKRLRAALLDAGVGGRGQAGRIREAMKSKGLLYLSPGSGSGLTHQQYQTKPISLHLAAGLGFALSG